MQYMKLVVLLMAGMVVWAGCSQPAQQPTAEQPQVPEAPAQQPMAEQPQVPAVPVLPAVEQPQSPAVTAQMPVAPETMPGQDVQQQVAQVAQIVAATAQEAIDGAAQLQTVAEKVNYLLTQAQSFYEAGQFEQVVGVAQYVLQNLDGTSAVAQDILAKAQAELQAAVTGGEQPAMGQAVPSATQPE